MHAKPRSSRNTDSTTAPTAAALPRSLPTSTAEAAFLRDMTNRYRQANKENIPPGAVGPMGQRKRYSGSFTEGGLRAAVPQGALQVNGTAVNATPKRHVAPERDESGLEDSIASLMCLAKTPGHLPGVHPLRAVNPAGLYMELESTPAPSVCSGAGEMSPTGAVAERGASGESDSAFTTPTPSRQRQQQQLQAILAAAARLSGSPKRSQASPKHAAGAQEVDKPQADASPTSTPVSTEATLPMEGTNGIDDTLQSETSQVYFGDLGANAAAVVAALNISTGSQTESPSKDLSNLSRAGATRGGGHLSWEEILRSCGVSGVEGEDDTHDVSHHTENTNSTGRETDAATFVFGSPEAKEQPPAPPSPGAAMRRVPRVRHNGALHFVGNASSPTSSCASSAKKNRMRGNPNDTSFGNISIAGMDAYLPQGVFAESDESEEDTPSARRVRVGTAVPGHDTPAMMDGGALQGNLAELWATLAAAGITLSESPVKASPDKHATSQRRASEANASQGSNSFRVCAGSEPDAGFADGFAVRASVGGAPLHMDPTAPHPRSPDPLQPANVSAPPPYPPPTNAFSGATGETAYLSPTYASRATGTAHVGARPSSTDVAALLEEALQAAAFAGTGTGGDGHLATPATPPHYDALDRRGRSAPMMTADAGMSVPPPRGVQAVGGSGFGSGSAPNNGSHSAPPRRPHFMNHVRAAAGSLIAVGGRRVPVTKLHLLHTDGEEGEAELMPSSRRMPTNSVHTTVVSARPGGATHSSPTARHGSPHGSPVPPSSGTVSAQNTARSMSRRDVSPLSPMGGPHEDRIGSAARQRDTAEAPSVTLQETHNRGKIPNEDEPALMPSSRRMPSHNVRTIIRPVTPAAAAAGDMPHRAWPRTDNKTPTPGPHDIVNADNLVVTLSFAKGVSLRVVCNGGEAALRLLREEEATSGETILPGLLRGSNGSVSDGELPRVAVQVGKFYVARIFSHRSPYDKIGYTDVGRCTHVECSSTPLPAGTNNATIDGVLLQYNDIEGDAEAGAQFVKWREARSKAHTVCAQQFVFLNLPFHLDTVYVTRDLRLCVVLYRLEAGDDTSSRPNVPRLLRDLQYQLQCKVCLRRLAS